MYNLNISLTQIHRFLLFIAVFFSTSPFPYPIISGLEIFQEQFISIHYTKLKGKKAIRESLASRWQKIVLFSSPLYAFGRGKQLHGTNWLIAVCASCCLVSGHQSPALMLLNALLPHTGSPFLSARREEKKSILGAHALSFYYPQVSLFCCSRLMRKSSRIFDDGAHFHWCWMPRAYPAQVNRPFRGNQRFFLFARRFSPRINQLVVRLPGAEEAFLCGERLLLGRFFQRNWARREVFDLARFGEKIK